MISLQSLIEAVQAAVVEAADQVRLKNISILNDYFVSADRPHQELPPGPLVPRMIQMAFPAVTEKGPTTHTVQVPLLSIAPPASLYLAEFRVNMRVEFELDKDRETVLKVAPARYSRRKDGQEQNEEASSASLPVKEFAEIEILIKSGDDPEGLTNIIQGYDRALRAEIPG